MEAELWLVVGLGNPTPRYHGTRHNAGFMVIDAICAANPNAGWRSSPAFSAEVARGRIGGHEAILLKPLTYMNLSGQSVGAVARHYGVDPDRVVAIHDDVDLGFGRLKLKLGGGDGGHKGIRSMVEHLGTPAFHRVRFGIGRPRDPAQDVVEFVLEPFGAEEREGLGEALDRAAEAVRVLVARGIREAMNQFNRPPPVRADEKKSEQSVD